MAKGPDLEQARSVTRQYIGEGLEGRSDFFMLPEVPHGVRAEEARSFQLTVTLVGKALRLKIAT